MSGFYGGSSVGAERQLPGKHALAVTPSDSADLAYTTRAIFVGGAGALKVRMLSGEDVVFTGVTAGTVLPIHAIRVWSSGTTATNITAIF